MVISLREKYAKRYTGKLFRGELRVDSVVHFADEISNQDPEQHSERVLGFVGVDQRHSLVTEHGARPARLKLLKRHAFDLVLVHLTLGRGWRCLDESFVLALDLLLVDAVTATHLRVVADLHRPRYDNERRQADDEQARRHDDGDQQFRPCLVQIESCHD